MIREFDVVVVGAGPIGGYLSRRFNEHGNSVLMIEEHDQIGRPFQCAGLVNPASMDYRFGEYNSNIDLGC